MEPFHQVLSDFFVFIFDIEEVIDEFLHISFFEVSFFLIVNSHKSQFAYDPVIIHVSSAGCKYSFLDCIVGGVGSQWNGLHFLVHHDVVPDFVRALLFYFLVEFFWVEELDCCLEIDECIFKILFVEFYFLYLLQFIGFGFDPEVVADFAGDFDLENLDVLDPSHEFC